jgi:hypothetical protein
MHPAMSDQLMQAQVADLHRQAQRDALSHAAGRARRARTLQHGRHQRGIPAAVARRVLAALTSSTA